MTAPSSLKVYLVLNQFLLLFPHSQPNFHQAFDKCYAAITPERQVVVSLQDEQTLSPI